MMQSRRAHVVIEKLEAATSVQLQNIDVERTKLKDYFVAGDDANVRRCHTNLERQVHQLTNSLRSIIQTCSQLDSSEEQVAFSNGLQPIQAKVQKAVAQVQRTIDETQPHHQQITDFDSIPSHSADVDGEVDFYGWSSRQNHRQINERELDDLKMTADRVQREAQAHQKLGQDIEELNEIFHDLAVMVHDQGDTIDSIEQNVENAQMDVNRANRDLKKAAKHNAAKYPIAGGLIGAAAVAGPVGLAIGLKTAAVAAVGGAVAGVFGGRFMRNNVKAEADKAM